jgi:hypothetical protein
MSNSLNRSIVRGQDIEGAPRTFSSHKSLESFNDRRTERLCFICLDGSEDSGDLLVSCCTRCYAVSHQGCWNEWRISQSHHAIRVRNAGNRVHSDPFICSICKSGSARVNGEKVTVRWLETFAQFSNYRSHSVRFATGLFSALSGARDESQRRDSAVDESDEEDVAEFIESDFVDNNETVVCGSTRKFIIVNILIMFLLAISDIILIHYRIVDQSNLLMMSLIICYVHAVVVGTYVFALYQQASNQRRLYTYYPCSLSHTVQFSCL